MTQTTRRQTLAGGAACARFLVPIPAAFAQAPADLSPASQKFKDTFKWGFSLWVEASEAVEGIVTLSEIVRIWTTYRQAKPLKSHASKISGCRQIPVNQT